MEAVLGIGMGSGGVAKDPRQIRAEVANGQTERLGKRPNRVGAGGALLALDQAQKCAGNPRFLADLFAGETLLIDMFGDVHTGLLHYVNFSGKVVFT